MRFVAHASWFAAAWFFTARFAALGFAAIGLLAACSGPESQEKTASTSRSGAEIVNQYCIVCHGPGLYDAPKLGDAAAWQAKLAEGREHLWQVVLTGEKAMPPRGNCPDCSDDELRAAMDYLLAAAESPAPLPSTATPAVNPR